MPTRRLKRQSRRRRTEPAGIRIAVLRGVLVLSLLALTAKLFHLQVMSHKFFSALASDQHGIFEQLFPERGEIFLTDPKAPDGRFPVAVNKNLTMVYADTRQLEKKDIRPVAEGLNDILYVPESTPEDWEELSTEDRELAEDQAKADRLLAIEALVEKLSAENDPYVPIRGKLEDSVVDQIRRLGLPGIAFSRQAFRFYPEKEAACHLTGFLGLNEEGQRVGRYGIEGYWDEELAGSQGFLESERDPSGRIITAGGHEFKPAKDGADILLAIDRNIQFVACRKLEEAVQKTGASGGATVVLEPDTGRILSVCGQPDFDPNTYSQTADMSAFNNPALYYAYEPGSVFKPLTMAAAIDAGKVSPKTIYEDTGEVEIGEYTIRNSDGKAHGLQTMTQVLEKSLNTGAIFAVRELGAKPFREYVEAFGFGKATGLGIDAEAKGDISSIFRRGDIWSATASYGQGITATPIQLASAFGALANGGKLMKPYIVAAVRYPDGTGQLTEPQSVKQVISKRTADLVSGMLVRVIEDGHGKKAGVPGYWVAGKTGTAQVTRKGVQGYEEGATIVTFIGFAPVDNPAFVLLTKLDRPQSNEFASQTAAPLFGDIASFLLQYLQIPPDRPVR